MWGSSLTSSSTGQEDELADATSKSLLRFTRDDLVRLCEERELDGEGTKKELVTALLEWVSPCPRSKTFSAHR